MKFKNKSNYFFSLYFKNTSFVHVYYIKNWYKIQWHTYWTKNCNLTHNKCLQIQVSKSEIFLKQPANILPQGIRSIFIAAFAAVGTSKSNQLIQNMSLHIALKANLAQFFCFFKNILTKTFLEQSGFKYACIYVVNFFSNLDLPLR